MQVIDLNRQPREEWRQGVLTRMQTSAVNGAGQLCIFEQWCEIGHGAPTHLHAVEEVLHVLDGQADVWIGEAHATLTSGQLVIVPAGRKHGFSQHRHLGAAHPVDTGVAGVRSGLRRQARDARWLPADQESTRGGVVAPPFACVPHFGGSPS